MTLVFSIHYFLWYGALTSIFLYEGVYARHYTNATTIQFGYLKMVLPFATVIVTPLVCSLADRRRAHRAFFVTAIAVAMLSMTSMALLSLIMGFGRTGESLVARAPMNSTGIEPKNESTEGIQRQIGSDKHLLILPWIFYCIMALVYDLAIGVTTCLSDSFAVLQAEESGTNFGRVIVWGTIGWASSALMLSLINQAAFLPRLMPGILWGTMLLTIDVVIVSMWHRHSDFLLDVIPQPAAQTLTGSSPSAHMDPSDYQPSNESTQVNLGSVRSGSSGELHRKTTSALQLTGSRKNRDERSTISPDFVSNGREKADVSWASIETIDSESQRSSLATSALSLPDSMPKLQSVLTQPLDANTTESIQGKKVMTPKEIIKTLLRPSDIVAKVMKKKKHINEPERQQQQTFQDRVTSLRVQLILFRLILWRRKSLIRYLIVFVLSGFFMAMHWNFFFLYLERIYSERFELISALSMVGQSVLGELPFFMLSRRFIEVIGRSHTLSVSVITIGVRFLLYRFLLPNVTMYLIFLADCFQGPNYGLFYVVMAEVGLEYSFCDDDTIDKMAARGEIDRNNKRQVDSLRLSLRSTVQSVAFACYEGLGVGLGSLIGGWLVHNRGFPTLWLSMAIGAISVGLANMAIDFLCPETDPEDGEKSARGEFNEARRSGVLKRITSPRPLPISGSGIRRSLRPMRTTALGNVGVESVGAPLPKASANPAEETASTTATTIQKQATVRSSNPMRANEKIDPGANNKVIGFLADGTKGDRAAGTNRATASTEKVGAPSTIGVHL